MIMQVYTQKKKIWINSCLDQLQCLSFLAAKSKFSIAFTLDKFFLLLTSKFLQVTKVSKESEKNALKKEIEQNIEMCGRGVVLGS